MHTSSFFMCRWQLRSENSRPTVKLWKLCVPSYRWAVERSASSCAGSILHARLRKRSVFCSSESAGAGEDAEADSDSGAGQKDWEVAPSVAGMERDSVRARLESGLGGISRYVGKKYVYFRLSHEL